MAAAVGQVTARWLLCCREQVRDTDTTTAMDEDADGSAAVVRAVERWLVHRLWTRPWDASKAIAVDEVTACRSA